MIKRSHCPLSGMDIGRRRLGQPGVVTTALVRDLRQIAYACLLVSVGATAAQAHAHIEHAVPAAGSAVHASPKEVELSFSEALEPAFSSVDVLDQKGGHVEEGKTQFGPDDAKVMRIALAPLAPGAYTVVWRALSIDTHRSSGRFTFSVIP
jgi:methionine-rich copper-binding protein CopC